MMDNPSIELVLYFYPILALFNIFAQAGGAHQSTLIRIENIEVMNEINKLCHEYIDFFDAFLDHEAVINRKSRIVYLR